MSDPSSADAEIQRLSATLNHLQEALVLLRRSNESLRHDQQDLVQGRAALLARIQQLETQLQQQTSLLDGAPYLRGEEHLTSGDRWLLQTSRADYTNLKELLAQQNWEAADCETQRIMLQVAGIEAQKQGFLTAEQLNEFPCLDLKILNKLWMIYSNGKYGFMVQREIWSRTNSTRNLWHSPEMDGYYPRREGLGHTLAQRLLRCALDDF